MKNFDNPGINLSSAIMSLMNQSSGTIEDIIREALNGICCFVQNQGNKSNCGGLNSIKGFSLAAEEEYKKQFESVSNSEDWKQVSGKLEKTFKFKDFKEALDFINKVGQISENMEHHPEIINVYDKVTLKLQTHDKGSITELDHKLAKKVDDIFNI